MGNDATLTDRQWRVITCLLATPSIEAANQRAKISKNTIYQWLKDENFRRELKRQRDLVIQSALDCLKANIAKATEILIKHLDSKRENISIRAAEGIAEFAQKAVEHKELEKRIEALEAKIMQQGGHLR